MVGMMKPPEAGILVRRLRTLGLDREEDQRALAGLIRHKRRLGRGQEIVDLDTAQNFAVLLTGVACLYKRLRGGNRQIYTFHYPGDLCGFHRYVLPEAEGEEAAMALSECSIGIIRYRDIDRAFEQHPKLGFVIWRVTMLEASILRERLVNLGRRPALERVAHLLCEQLARREVIGVSTSIVPLNQIDLADAAGLSVVHINRIFQELRKLGVLSDKGRTIEVLDKERLMSIAEFDGRYLHMGDALRHWEVAIDNSSDEGNVEDFT
jgi:CRP-like cAMP-binding protein